MEIRHASGSPFETGAELTVVAVCGDPKKDPSFKAADKVTAGLLAKAATQERFAGKPGQAVHVHAGMDGKARRIAVLGAGDRGAVTPAQVRDLAAQAVQ